MPYYAPPSAMPFEPQQAMLYPPLAAVHGGMPPTRGYDVFTHQRVIELPTFSGTPEEWPAFYATYCQTTTSFRYTTLDNLYRLQRSLTGDARQAVEPLLIHHENVERVMASLAFRFGRPELLAHSQIAKVRAIESFDDRQIEKLVPFASTVENLVAFLRIGHCEYELANPSLLTELLEKLPMSKRLEWSQHSAYMMPRATIAEFSQWLNTTSQYVILAMGNTKLTPVQKQSKPTVMHVADTQSRPSLVCSFCTKTHKHEDCFKFRDWTTDKRWEEVKRHHLCFSCLSSSHNLPGCRNKRRCAVNNCPQYHHPLLHDSTSGSRDESADRNREQNDNSTTRSGGESRNQPPPSTRRSEPRPSTNRSESQQPNSTNPFSSPSLVQRASVNQCRGGTSSLPLLFKIVPVVLYSRSGSVLTYAFLDEGSNVSLIDEGLANDLGLSGPSTHVSLEWFGNVAKTVKSRSVSFEISAASTRDRRFRLENVTTVPNINLPTQTVNLSNLRSSQQYMRHLPVLEYESAEPKLLIGLDYAHLAAPQRTLRGSIDTPTVMNSDLGWIVYGRQTPSQHQDPCQCYHIRLSNIEAGIDELVRDYFETENFGVKVPTRLLESADDARARRMLTEATVRVGERFQTALLWRKDDVRLPHSYNMALRRLISVERKMARDLEYAALYRANIESYVTKGYARCLTDEEAQRSGPRTWYLPHFGVTNPHKPGKLRMVFDAAACVDGVSLNSTLLSGPDMNPPLTEILFKFRVGVVAVCGDIREMYHQVLMQPSDQGSQRFLWRSGDGRQTPKVYEMVAMTFGATCSPAAAQFTKNLNADENAIEFPSAVEAIKNLHYVDDYVASFTTSAEATDVTMAVTEVHRRGGFELRNFVSNNEDVLRAVGAPPAATSIRMQLTSPSNGDRILGMCWDTYADEFLFDPSFTNFENDVLTGRKPPTKRQVLGISMSVFDPFGILADFMIHAKLLVQDLWRAGSRWDEAIPQSLHERWIGWCSQLTSLSTCRVARCYSPHLRRSTDVQLHVFADASEAAFAAVAYWRVSNVEGYDVSFIAGKTKCAPLKLLSIPRLELQAAVLATRLLCNIRTCHNIDVSRTVLWTDSKTVMLWIRSDHRRYKPFVAHRVAEILEDTTEANWRWIPTGLNVADDATRARAAPTFNNSSRWLRGPDFLRLDEDAWPQEVGEIHDSEVEMEVRQRFVGVAVVRWSVFNPDKFSFYGWLRRSAALAMRFITNVTARIKNHERVYGELTVAELLDAELLLCRLVQAEAFADEYAALTDKRAIDANSSIRNLVPYLDERGTMRVYGRADAADSTHFSFDAKRPIVMPKTHRLTWLIVDFYHRRMCHQNDNAVVCAVRQKFWVPHLRSVVRKARLDCMMCRLRTAQPAQPLMGQLPIDRVTPYLRPFSYTGLDFFGPLSVTVGRRQEKRWAALFTCLSVRAVHIELAQDLSTDACLLCVRNFANIRGVPIRIRSDNGTNFIDASKVVRDTPDFFDDVRMRRELASLGIDWIFNSPGHPEAGGCWERMVQCVKRVLVMTLKERAPRVETLRTLLIEAANIVNSRPLTHVPVSPSDEEPITPNHFLIGTGCSTTIPSGLDERVWCLRKQWRIAQQLTSRFWSQWVKEYLPELTRRTKWHRERPPISVGDLVLVCDANQSRNEWRRGRVSTLFPGPDGRVRNVEVTTTAGVLRRPVSKLAVLDVSKNDEPQTVSVHGGGDVADST